MTTNLAAVTLLHNVNAIKYPWRQSFLSAIDIVDKFVWVVAPHNEDDTEEFVLKTNYTEKVIIVTGSKDLAVNAGKLGFESYYIPEVVWPQDHDGLSELVNIGVDMAGDGSNPNLWAFQLQADEVLDEADYTELLKIPTLPDNFKAASWRFRHYCGDFHHIFPFMYAAADFPAQAPQRIVRCARYDSNWVNAGDAAQMLGNGDIYDSSVVVHHCGKVHVGRSKEAAKKEYDFQTQLYTSVFDPDPRVVKAYQDGGIDYFKLMQDAKEFNGPWPRWVKDYAKELGVEL